MSELILHIQRRPFDLDDYREQYDSFIPCDQGPLYINVDDRIRERMDPEQRIQEFLSALERDGLGRAVDEQSFVLLPNARRKVLGPRYPLFHQTAQKLLTLTQEQMEQRQPCFLEALQDLSDALTVPSPYVILWTGTDGWPPHWLRLQKFLLLAEPGVPYYIGPVVWCRFK